MPRKRLASLAINETREVSLVDAGANKKKRFPIAKSQEVAMSDIFEAVLETEIENEEEVVKSFGEDLDESGKLAITSLLRTLNGFKDELSSEFVAKALEQVGFEKKALPPEFEENKFPKKKKKAKKEGEEEYPAPKAKKVAKEESEEVTEKVAKEEEKVDEKMDEIFKAQQGQIEELQKALQSEKDARKLAEFVAKCEAEYAFVPGLSADKMGDMLMKAYEVGEEFGKSLEDQWAATSKTVEKSAQLTTAGNIARGEDSPEAQLEAKAKEIAKAENITVEKAYSKAMDQNPELYGEYLADHPAQRQR